MKTIKKVKHFIEQVFVALFYLSLLPFILGFVIIYCAMMLIWEWANEY